MSHAALFKKWSKWLQRIYSQQLQHLLIHRHIFKQLQECAAYNIGETYGAELLQWMVQNYVAFASTAIRRMTETPTAKWQSVSLVILLDDLAKHDSVLTCRRCRALYEKGLPFYRDRKARVWEIADRNFDEITRNKKSAHLSAARIQRDLNEIKRVCDPVRRLVSKVVAHTEADRRKIGRLRFGQIDKAIDLLADTFRRYSLLVDCRVSNPLVPLDSFDVRDELKRIWASK